MSRLMHLAPASLQRRIERSGLRGGPWRLGEMLVREAIFAMPVLADDWATHQWLRELRRWRPVRHVAVHFRVPDSEPVLVGPFGATKTSMSAAKAADMISGQPPNSGFEVVVQRRVARRDVLAIREVRQDIGWAQHPAHGREDCVCAMCLPKGSPDLQRRCRAAYLNGIALAAAHPDRAATLLRNLDLAVMRGRRFDASKLKRFVLHENAEIRRSALWLLQYFEHHGEDMLLRSLGDEDINVATTAFRSLMEQLHVNPWDLNDEQGLLDTLRTTPELDIDGVRGLVQAAVTEP